jgi:hypothetical protein
MKKQQEVEQVERGKETITLECILTDDEKLKYSKTIAESVSKKARAEDALKSFQTQQKAEIAGFDASINSIAEKLSTGREYRPVECRLVLNFKTKTKNWVRTDTGEIGRTVPLDESDYQEPIPLEKK